MSIIYVSISDIPEPNVYIDIISLLSILFFRQARNIGFMRNAKRMTAINRLKRLRSLMEVMTIRLALNVHVKLITTR